MGGVSKQRGNMTKTIVEHVYTFGDLNIVNRRSPNGRTHVWAVKCDGCCEEIVFKFRQPKIWEASCPRCKIMITITPWEYSILKPMDFQRIMGAQ
jgi:hypothetical protein